MKDYLKSMNSMRNYFMLAALVCGIVATVVYGVTWYTEFTPDFDGSITALFVIFCVLAFIMLFPRLELRIVKYLTSAIGLLAFLLYIVYEINYITNIFVSIDPTPVTAGFVLTLVFGLLAWVFALVSAVITGSGVDYEKKQKKNGKDKNEDVDFDVSEEAEA